MTRNAKWTLNTGGMDCPDFDDLKELAKELGRPVTTLVALSVDKDPFYIGPKRQVEAEWFAEIWRRFDCKPGAHGRRVHYIVISQEQPVLMPNGKPYQNTLECFGFLCEASRDARYLDLVPLRDMADRRSDEAIINLSDDVETEAEIAFEGGLHVHVPPGFDVPCLGITAPIIPQRYHVEIWVEKSTMNDILEPLGERYGINIVYGVGEMSLTRCVQLVDRAMASGKPVRILYISDFDPGGMSMPVAVARKVEFVIRKEEHDLDIQVRPIVLSHEQCIEYRLQRMPIKEEETRKDVFEERFGEGATELDALEALHPGELQRILEREIARYYDDDLERRIDDAASDVQAELDDINEDVERRHAKAIKSLKAEREKIVKAIDAFEEKARPVLADIESDLDDVAPDVDSYEWPEAEPGDEDDDPLFDTTRDYVEQIDRYKAHQGKTTEFKTTELVCMQCGETFVAMRSNKKCCSRKCKNAFLASEYRSVKTKTERACSVCGTMFVTGREESKYCSGKCKAAAHRKKLREAPPLK